MKFPRLLNLFCQIVLVGGRTKNKTRVFSTSQRKLETVHRFQKTQQKHKTLY